MIGHISKKSVLMALSVIAAAGCATIETSPQRGTASVNTQTVLPVPGTRGQSETAGAAFAYQFVGSNLPADGQCRVRFIQKKSGKSFFVTIAAGQSAAFAPLEPGIYDVGRLGCGITRVYEMTDLYPEGFQVESNKASYLGKLIFKFDGKDLTEVNKAGRSASAAAFSEVSSVVPVGTSIISAFTLAPITNEMASEGSTTDGFSVRAKGMEGPSLNTLLSDLQRCEKNVAKADPLRFGTLDYVAAYKAGRFSEFKERRDTNAFPEMLKDCVTETLSAFTPPAKAAVEIRVIY
ncbi:MAG TPA: hypothetical protein VM432_14000 [Bdellovibrionales bacterium]|jgi:hypothetical protein|nr:hypothetical protein [Bdellovibrionales bacterium]